MNIELTEEHQLVRSSIRSFAEEKIAPYAGLMDKEARILPEILEELAIMGLWGILIPEKYGGSESDTLTYIIIIEEISRICASTGLALSVHNALGTSTICNQGTEEQKSRFLFDLAAGKKIIGFSMTEPNAGSDARGLECLAIEDGNNFILNGSKIFVSNTGIGSVFLIATRFQTNDGQKGMTTMIVEKDMEGFEIGPKEDKMGMRGNQTRSFYFNNVRIPKENILGEMKDGFKIAMQTLNFGRIGIAAQSLGIAQAAYEQSVEYAKGRIQFKKPIFQFQGISFKLAEMATKLDAARLLVYKTAHLRDQNKNYSKESAMCKFYASKTARQISQEAIQIHGGYGYMKDLPLERYYRDAKLCEIYEGTSEIMKIIIANQLLKGNI
ncbi:MAG: acyl-CoA dehydrogenase family protein [Candidatus Lokiarchaeota archaeon]|nr:acyl-CoA dehydrogenase family protein [Candidatus Lokiarchaeota archaeon]